MPIQHRLKADFMWFRRLWPALLWALVILVLTGIPGSYIPQVKSFWEWLSYDKLVHFFIFGVLSYLLLNGFREQYLNGNFRLMYTIVLILLSMAYGLLTEVLQVKVFVGRDGNIYDFLADSIGVLIGWLAFYLWHRKKNSALRITKTD